MAEDTRSHGGLELAQAVSELYQAGQTDYSLEPIVLVDQHSKPIGRITDGDAVIFCCRRGEREIQLTEAFVDYDQDYFPRQPFKHLPFVILTLYHEKFRHLPVAFAPDKVKDTLAETISKAHLRQLHISESEKFSHITFFFNGGENRPLLGETDIRIPSPKGLPFDQVPELSLAQVADQLIDNLENGYDFIVTNFANGDVIGHTQNRQAKVVCAECLDFHLGRVIRAAQAAGYLVLVTADHGNLEELYTSDGKPHVSHTANPVPFVLVSPHLDKNTGLPAGTLSDIAPTILSILGISTPTAMQGQPLIPTAHKIKVHPVLLIILDGWGIGPRDDTNPIQIARTPVWDSLIQDFPFTTLHASGTAVGLQAGKAGNSEAGHMNMGAGRVVLQDDVRLDAAIQDGSFYTNHIFRYAIDHARHRQTNLHLIGLLSYKSSHGSIDYPLALLRMARDAGLQQVFVHLIFDGRSTQPGSAPAMLADLERKVSSIGVGKIVTGMGRSIALDRDGNYARTRMAYEALVVGIGRPQPAAWE